MPRRCQIAKTRDDGGQTVLENFMTVVEVVVGCVDDCHNWGVPLKFNKAMRNSTFLSQDLVRTRPKRVQDLRAAIHKIETYLNIIFKEKHDDI